jgi:hypothetical protein
MQPIIIDLAKEIVVLGLGSVTTWIWNHVRGLAKDLNASFAMVRDLKAKNTELEDRLAKLEKK